MKTESANLRAAIDTEGETTAYHFNWGLTTGYGNSTATGNLPAGAQRPPASAKSPASPQGSTYHYQIVATNGTGTTMGPDQTFTTPAQEPGLPGARGYEIVSQYPTGGVPMIPTGAIPPQSAPTETTSCSSSYNPLPNTPPGLADQFGQGAWMYDSVRGEGAWNITGTKLITEFFEAGISGDAQHILKLTSVGVDPDDQNEVVRPLHAPAQWRIRLDIQGSADSRGRTADRRRRRTDRLRQRQLNSYPSGTTLTPDGSTVVFTSKRQLSDLDTSKRNCLELYKWEKEGGVTFIGMRPDGTVPDPPPATALPALNRPGRAVGGRAPRHLEGGADRRHAATRSTSRPTANRRSRRSRRPAFRRWKSRQTASLIETAVQCHLPRRGRGKRLTRLLHVRVAPHARLGRR